MLSIDESIVKEYLEWNGFWVKPLRKSRPQSKRGYKEEGVDLLIKNQNLVSGGRDPAFMLFNNELRYVDSALICVRGWHGEKAALAAKTSGADMQRYLETHVLKNVKSWFETDKSLKLPEGCMRILVAPAFPMQEPYRQQCAVALKEKGVDAILSFKSMVLDLIDQVETKEIYQKSDLLQLVRILKTMDLIKDSQMSF